MHLILPRALLALLFALAVAACGPANPSRTEAPALAPLAGGQGEAAAARAVFAAGCFWCVEQAFDGVEGVLATVSGYTGGHVPDPGYRAVTSGRTGHFEALEVSYDPQVVSYETLLATFWRNVDPTDDGGQFCDRGSSYRGAIFALDEDQRRSAEASRQALIDDPDAPAPIVTPVLPGAPFYAAEDYHQNYYQKNPLRYGYYKNACGRVARLAEVWGPA